MNTDNGNEVERVLDLIRRKREGGDPLAMEDLVREHPELERVILEFGPLLLAMEGMKEEPALQESLADHGFADYRIVRELGRGGMGVVYEAEQVSLGRRVALKLMAGPSSERLLRRFHREALAASRLDHPGICTVYDAGVENGQPFIAMRLVEGVSLADRIRERRAEASSQTRPDSAVSESPLSQTQVELSFDVSSAEVTREVELVEKAALALHAAHEAGVIHRDVKPGNIMVTPEGEPMVLDFGLAWAEQAEDMITRSGDVFGTPHYMSPEQLESTATVTDARTDVWSLGVTLYELVTLRRPFEAPTRAALHQAIRDREPAAPRKLNPCVSRSLSTVVLTALQKDLDRRYQSAADLAEDLRRIRHHEPIRARSISVPERVWRWARRRPAQAGLALAVPTVMVLVVFILGHLSHIQAEKARRLEADVAERLEKGFFAIAERESAQAIPHFQAALDLEPGSVEAVGGTALSWLRVGYPERALEILDGVQGGASDHASLLRIRIDALERLGRSQEAADLKQQVKEPEDELGCFIVGLRQLALGTNESRTHAIREARRYLEEAILRADRARALYHYHLAWTAGFLEDARLSRSISRTILERWPDSDQALWWAAYAYRKTDPKERRRLLERAVELHPDSARFRRTLAIVYHEGGRYQEALVHAKRAVELDPKASGTHVNLGMVLALLGKTEQACEEFRVAQTCDPPSAPGFFNEAILHMEGRRHEKAVELFKRATETRPHYPGAFWLQGNCFMKMGRHDEAVLCLEEATRQNPEHYKAWYDLGRSLGRLKRQDASLNAYQQSVAINDSWHVSWLGLGNALNTAGRRKEAIAAFERTLELSPGYARAHCNLGLTLRAEGDLAGSVEQLRKGHALGQELGERWNYPSESWLKISEDLLARERVLEPMLAGDRPFPEDTAELAELAEVARLKRWELGAARLLLHAFGIDGTLEARLGSEAAFSAIAVGLGFAEDARWISSAERSRWLAQGRRWLSTALDERLKRYARRRIRAEDLGAELERWRANDALEVIMADPGRLSPAERAAWERLSAKLDAALEEL